MYFSSSTGWQTRCARTPAFLRASSNLAKAPSQVCRSVIGCSICSVAIAPFRSVARPCTSRETNAPSSTLRAARSAQPLKQQLPPSTCTPAPARRAAPSSPLHRAGESAYSASGSPGRERLEIASVPGLLEAVNELRVLPRHRPHRIARPSQRRYPDRDARSHRHPSSLLLGRKAIAHWRRGGPPANWWPTTSPRDSSSNPQPRRQHRAGARRTARVESLPRWCHEACVLAASWQVELERPVACRPRPPARGAGQASCEGRGRSPRGGGDSARSCAVLARAADPRDPRACRAAFGDQVETRLDEALYRASEAELLACLRALNRGTAATTRPARRDRVVRRARAP